MPYDIAKPANIRDHDRDSGRHGLERGYPERLIQARNACSIGTKIELIPGGIIYIAGKVDPVINAECLCR